MSTAATEHKHDDHGDHSSHPAHLAHHFDTMGQQFDAGKLGMWVFLATEILMFGGLFCAYAVYRANNPDVFAFAHKELNTTLGAINTVVLIASSLTMAWAVRCSQLGQNRGLILCLALSLLGGFGFLSIKTIEYTTKWNHHLWVGTANEFHPNFKGEKHSTGHDAGHDAKPGHDAPKPAPTAPAPAPTAPAPAPAPASIDGPAVERSIVPPPQVGEAGVVPRVLTGEPEEKAHHAVHLADLSDFDKPRVHIFFQIYYMMTGLHGVHVLLGMGLMFWVLVRAVRPAAKLWVSMLAPTSIFAFVAYVGAIIGSWPLIYTGAAVAVAFGILTMIIYDRNKKRRREGAGEFGPNYFIPVDLVGLYWHLVDLIWIFLFPLLYLIH